MLVLKYRHVKRNLLTIITCQVINSISKNVTNFLLNQLKNVVHPYSYDLSNCYRTWYPFRPQSFCRRSRLYRTWPIFHIYVFGQISLIFEKFYTFIYLNKIYLMHPNVFKTQQLNFNSSFYVLNKGKLRFFDFTIY